MYSPQEWRSGETLQISIFFFWRSKSQFSYYEN